MKTLRRGFAATAAGLLIAGGVAGCGGQVVKKSEVESKISDRLTQGGEKVESVKCDDDLKAEKDATTECTAKAGGKEQKLKVTVTSVEDKTVNFSIEAA